MKDILIVDNSAYSFGFNVNNGIPILSYYEGENDWELLDLIDFLISIKNDSDLWISIQQKYKMLDLVEQSIKDSIQ